MEAMANPVLAAAHLQGHLIRQTTAYSVKMERSERRLTGLQCCDQELRRCIQRAWSFRDYQLKIRP